MTPDIPKPEYEPPIINALLELTEPGERVTESQVLEKAMSLLGGEDQTTIDPKFESALKRLADEGVIDWDPGIAVQLVMREIEVIPAGGLKLK